MVARVERITKGQIS